MGIHAYKDKVTLIVSEERGILVKVATLMNLHSWETFFFLFDLFVSHLFLFLMGLVCNWLCVHHFCSIMLEGKISTFVVLSIVFATIFSIGEYNWIYASLLQCCCVIKWKVEYLDPFEKKKKRHVILFFFTKLTLLKSENGVNVFFFFFFPVVWSFGNLPFGFPILYWVALELGL